MLISYVLFIATSVLLVVEIYAINKSQKNGNSIVIKPLKIAATIIVWWIAGDSIVTGHSYDEIVTRLKKYCNNIKSKEGVVFMGKLIKEIKPAYSIHIWEMILGVCSIGVNYIRPVKDYLLDAFTIWGMDAGLFFYLMGIITIVYSLYKLVRIRPNKDIKIYENGLSIGDFTSEFSELAMRVKKISLELENNEEKIVYKERLKRRIISTWWT